MGSQPVTEGCQAPFHLYHISIALSIVSLVSQVRFVEALAACAKSKYIETILAPRNDRRRADEGAAEPLPGCGRGSP